MLFRNNTKKKIKCKFSKKKKKKKKSKQNEFKTRLYLHFAKRCQYRSKQ